MEGYTKYQSKKKTIREVTPKVNNPEIIVNSVVKNAGVEQIVDMKGKGAATKGLKFKVRA
tara:strand:+ start:951 stop:1130 length:180 start_codon:yes stop_codon:yes gene_type:complete